MGFAKIASALFAISPKATSPVSSFLGSAPVALSSVSSSTALFMVAADFAATGVTFFTSIRIPAALIAGSAGGLFFIKLNQNKDHQSKLQKSLLFFYHTVSLMALLLALNVIVLSTSAGNNLLLGQRNTVANSVYDFLQREIKYEYVLTRWSFYASILSFLQAVGSRALIEFDLLKREKLRSGMIVFFTMAAMISHVLHLVNDCLITYPNFWQMTVGVCKLFLDRMINRKSRSMLLLSFTSAIIAFGSLLSFLPEYIRPKEE